MRQINSIIKIALWLFIIRNIIGIFQLLYLIGFSDITLSVFSIIQGIIMIVILSNMLRVKSRSLYAFFVFQALNVVVLTLIEDGNFIYDLAKHSVTAVILCAIISAILFLKKDGLSGWQVFLHSAANDDSENEDIQSVEPPQSESVMKTFDDGCVAIQQGKDELAPIGGENIYDLPGNADENESSSPVEESNVSENTLQTEKGEGI